jgi:hypothetical protein
MTLDSASGMDYTPVERAWGLICALRLTRKHMRMPGIVQSVRIIAVSFVGGRRARRS